MGGNEPLDGVKGDCNPNMLQKSRNRDKTYVCATPETMNPIEEMIKKGVRGGAGTKVKHQQGAGYVTV